MDSVGFQPRSPDEKLTPNRERWAPRNTVITRSVELMALSVAMPQQCRPLHNTQCRDKTKIASSVPFISGVLISCRPLIFCVIFSNWAWQKNKQKRFACQSLITKTRSIMNRERYCYLVVTVLESRSDDPSISTQHCTPRNSIGRQRLCQLYSFISVSNALLQLNLLQDPALSGACIASTRDICTAPYLYYKH
jgi:hypothetical protein